jgi:transcriptional antiterminator NusG
MNIDRWDDSDLSPEALAFKNHPMPVFPFIEDVYRVGSARKWFVVYTAPRAEDKAAEGLSAKGFEPYAPKQFYWRPLPPKSLRKRKGEERTRAERPLMNRYVLARLPISPKGEVPFGAVRAINGVVDLVCVSGAPITVSDATVETIKKREDEGDFDETFIKKQGSKSIVMPKWAEPGQTIEVMDGPFRTFLAVIEDVLPNRVRAAVSIFGRPTMCEFQLAQVQAKC